ncbi:hypothetical protein EIP91_007546 [Steccherinum ochraceum]|uniref:RNA polymerase II elongation factor ELL N-terminal domain-containing protein n=1 Tax=Steccherinum ochraceum TaxID=92696 RepID=A0A4R0RED9_9APHY|nr:hypothetical protein EIP91_007546 [Steccherinum ochraceum]
MPLPNDATLSLQRYTNPGDSTQSTPFPAMLVRMTAETFEELEKQDKPHMQIQFGKDNGSVIINGVSYPFQLSAESSAHEIYLRTAQPNKPNAPLRLFANVSAKLAVQRDLREVEQQIRGRAQEAEKQRNERQVMYLKDPPPPTKPPKKKPTAARKVAAADTDSHRNLSAPSSSLPTRGPSPRAASPSPPPNPDLRARLINILGHNPHATHGLILEFLGIGRSEADKAARQEVFAHLKHVGEYVREGDRNTVGEWKLLPQLRSKVSVEPPTKGGPAETKRRVASEPRPKKPRASEPGPSREERAPSRINTLKEKDRDFDDASSPGTPTSSKAAPAARRPGSGYKAPKAGSITPDPNPPPPRRPAPSDPREVKREAPSPSLPPATARPVAMHDRTPSAASASGARLPHKPKDPGGMSASRSASAALSKHDRHDSPGLLAPSSSAPTIKRKKPAPDYDDYSDRDDLSNMSFSKKRKVEGSDIPIPRVRDKHREEAKERDLSLPKKPVTSYNAATRRDLSPLPPKARSAESPKAKPRERERERERASHASPMRLAASPLPDRERHKDKERERDRDRDRGRDWDSDRGDRDRDRDRGRGRDRESEREREREADKERDHERGRDRDRDRRDRERERERSPARHHKASSENGASVQSQRSSGSAKPRRKSPTYTSSEDENESSTRTVVRTNGAPPSSTSAASVTSHSNNGYIKMEVDEEPVKPPTNVTNGSSRRKEKEELPTDPNALQRMYKSLYPKYIQLHWAVISARDNLQDAISHYDSPDSDLENDGTTLLSFEHAADLKSKLDSSRAQLETIKQVYLSYTGMDIDEGAGEQDQPEVDL